MLSSYLTKYLFTFLQLLQISMPNIYLKPRVRYIKFQTSKLNANPDIEPEPLTVWTGKLVIFIFKYPHKMLIHNVTCNWEPLKGVHNMQ